MAQRRWTFMVIPHGTADTRIYSVSERAVRAALSTVTVIGAIAAVSVGVMAARVSPASARVAAGDGRGSDDQIIALQARLISVGDTLAAIEKREQRIRLLAGLTSPATAPDNAAPLASPDSLRLAMTPADSADIRRVTLAPDIDFLLRRANSLAASSAEVFDSLTRNVDRIARIPSIMPTAGWLSSIFSRSRFHPILHTSRPHEGIDVSAPMGAPIVAPAAGIVTRVAVENGYGNVLEVDHGNGLVTKYAHCSRILVKLGQHLRRGQIVAAVGNSGLSTGPHLHYEIHLNGKVVDPLTYVLPGTAIPD